MKIVTIGDISKQIRGVTYEKSDASSEPQSGFLPVLRAGNIVDGEIDLGDLVYIPKNKINPNQYLRKGDILIAASSGSLSVVGKAASVRQDYEAGFGAFCKVLRPSEKVYPPYFANYFQTQSYRHIVSNLAAGANINNLRNEHLDNLEIPLPPLAEQQRIAAILDKADELRAKRRAALAKLDTLLQATFLHMFGDPVTNPMGWDVKRLDQFGKIVTGSTPSREKSEYYGDYIEWIKSDNINTPYHILTPAQEYLSKSGFEVGRSVPKNSILITCIAGSPECIGNAAIADRSVAFNQQINAITPNQDGTTYFLYVQFIVGKRLVQSASTNSMKGMVSKSSFSGVEFVSPPLEMQHKFSQRAINIQREVDKQTRSLEELDNLFHTLQQRAFKGEL